MKSAIISDIHGNLPALEKLIKNTQFVDRYVILGDVVNYGTWSNCENNKDAIYGF